MCDPLRIGNGCSAVRADGAIYTNEMAKNPNIGHQIIESKQPPVNYGSAYRIGSMIKRKLSLRKAAARYKFNYVRMAIIKANGFKNKVIALNTALLNVGINIAEKLYKLFKLCIQIAFCICIGGISLFVSTFIVDKLLGILSSIFAKMKKALMQYMKEKLFDQRIINIVDSTLDLIAKIGSLVSSIIFFIEYQPPSLDKTFVDEILRLMQAVETAIRVAKMPQSIVISAKKVVEDAKAFNSTDKIKEIAKSTLDKIKQALKEIFNSFLSVQGIITLIKSIFYSIHKFVYNITEEYLDSKITI